ncbi:MAG: beta-lactamase family protein [Deltaproteobacteria bacterium]|nr:beta-lactamase family protein [Deltaproteobacteria bacterium]MCW5805261.1 beta-lactamase family protein [Deltaproteobacteria bacterium]
MFRPRWTGALAAAIALACACSSPPKKPKLPVTDPSVDPEGPHRAQVEAQLRPYLDGELVSGIVVGLYDLGKREIYGFGTGPGKRVPDGATLFALGPVTKVYMGVLLADAIQRKEVELDAPIADLLPPGVTVPTRDRTPITVRHLALHSSGLPAQPPSVNILAPNPYATYDEEALYRDLLATELDAQPGAGIQYSNYGAGLLGFALGRKLGGGFAKALETRVLAPLELRDTFFTVPAGAAGRRALGSDDDLAPAQLWTWSALAGAGGLVSTVRDQLKFLEVQLDAAAGGKLPLRPAVRLTHEAQLENERSAENEGLGWMIDSAGRYWHGGGGGGFRSYLSFDPKTRRGVVVLASTNASPLDTIGRLMWDVLGGTAKPAFALPAADKLAELAGTYELGGAKLQVVASGKRLYLEGGNEPRRRIVPFAADRYWIEAFQSLAVFQRSEDDARKVTGIVFSVGGRQIVARRVE